MSRFLLFTGAVIVVASLVVLDVSCITHWRVTESGRIEHNDDSPFTLLRPYDLVSFFSQADRIRRIGQLKETLNSHETVVKKDMNKKNEGFTTVANYQEEFYKSDSDCQKAGQPLAKLPYYETYSVKWHEHGLYMPKESLEISKHQIKYHKKPFCDVALLPFNMGNLDHLEGVRAKDNFTMLPDIDLIPKIMIESEDFYGHMVHTALTIDPTSWVYLTMAGDYFRIKGDFKNAIKCMQRSIHYSPPNYKHLSFLSFASFLQKSHFLKDSLALALAAHSMRPRDAMISYYLGNIHVTLNDLDGAYYWYEKSVSLDPYFQSAKQKKLALLCHLKLEKFLEDQHESLKKKLEKLKDFQTLNDEWMELTNKIELDKSSQARREYTKRAYKEFLNRKSNFCDWKQNHKLDCQELPLHFSYFPFNNQSTLQNYASRVREARVRSEEAVCTNEIDCNKDNIKLAANKTESSHLSDELYFYDSLDITIRSVRRSETTSSTAASPSRSQSIEETGFIDDLLSDLKSLEKLHNDLDDEDQEESIYDDEDQDMFIKPPLADHDDGDDDYYMTRILAERKSANKIIPPSSVSSSHGFEESK